MDVEFVRKSVRSIGRVAVKLERACERAMNVLLDAGLLWKYHGNLRYPPQSYPPPINKALIAGLITNKALIIKGNQWLIVP